MFKSPTRPSPSCRPRCSAHPDLCRHLSSFSSTICVFKASARWYLPDMAIAWFSPQEWTWLSQLIFLFYDCKSLFLKGSKVMQTKRKGRCGQTKSVSPPYTHWVRRKTCLGQTHAKINCQIWEAVSHIAYCFHDLFFLSRKRLERVRNNFDITCPIPDKAQIEDKTFPRGTSGRWCDDPAGPWVVVAVLFKYFAFQE